MKKKTKEKEEPPYTIEEIILFYKLCRITDRECILLLKHWYGLKV